MISLVSDKDNSMQRMLDFLTGYARKWRFLFNVNKCESLLLVSRIVIVTEAMMNVSAPFTSVSWVNVYEIVFQLNI